MGLFSLFAPKPAAVSVQTAREQDRLTPEFCTPTLRTPDCQLYDALRETIPLVDGALDKLIRLTGAFQVQAQHPRAQQALDRFLQQVPVGGNGQGIQRFLWVYLDNLLTYGNAVGEMVLTRDGRTLAGLYNAPLDRLAVRGGQGPFHPELLYHNGLSTTPIPYPELILFTPLNPPAGSLRGRSILYGLPFVAGILTKIYRSIGQNFERMGNLRFAVTYRPKDSAVDRAYSQEIAQTIAQEWSQAMSASGPVRDFVAVGDVDIKVIGADNQVMDSQIPVREMLEQIIAKLGLPPFVLGLSWSSTERMSRQQADILTSELESYRTLLTPVIEKICRTYLLLEGLDPALQVVWEDINLQDELESAQAQLYRAQAEQLTNPGGEGK